MSYNAVETSIFIESYKMWSVPLCLKSVSSVICVVGVIMWTHVVTFHAEGILLSGIGMNMCPIELLFLDQWHNTCEVTNSARRIIQEPISVMTTAKTLQDETSTSGCCGIMWHNCASFYIVIQIMSMTLKTALVEQSYYLFIVIHATYFTITS